MDDPWKAMEGKLDIVEKEVFLGQAEVRAAFGSRSGRVAGCMINEGKLVKGCELRVMRGDTAVHAGRLDSLKRVNKIAREVSLSWERFLKAMERHSRRIGKAGERCGKLGSR